MGHVLFAAPSIERFHLHERLARALQRRGHRVTVLAADPVTRRCYGLHGLPSIVLAPERPLADSPLDLSELAVRDLRLAGVARPSLLAIRHHRSRLARRMASAARHLETDLPDLVWFHGGRDGLSRMLHGLARHYGVATVHTGAGGIAGLVQRDPSGVDGDARALARAAIDYRDVTPDRELIQAALATAVSGPAGLPPRRPLLAPDGIDAIAGLLDGARQRAWRTARTRLRAWRTAASPPRSGRPKPYPFPPKAPFVAVLLQHPDDPRVRLDVDAPAPPAETLVQWVTDAARSHDPGLAVHAIPPQVPPAARATAIAVAAAVVTINDPAALIGVLAGTPVVHLGHARYGIVGVARRASAATLADELALALGVDQPTLRLRFATRTLGEDHVWCDPDAPDANGLAGLVQDFEERLARAVTPPPPLVYRPDPPLG